MSDLNLLPSQAKFQAQRLKLAKKINSFVMIFSLVWVVLVLIEFFVWFMVKIQVNAADKQRQQAINQYQSLKENVVTTQKLKYEAKLVGGVLADRFEYSWALEKITGLFEGYSDIVKYELKGKNDFAYSGLTMGSDNMNKVEKKIELINSGLDPVFSKVKVNELSVEQDLWQFDLEVFLKNEK